MQDVRHYDMTGCAPICRSPMFHDVVFQSPPRTKVPCASVPQLTQFCRKQLTNQTLLQLGSGPAVYFVPQGSDKHPWSKALQLCRQFGAELVTSLTPSLTSDLYVIAAASYKGAAVSWWSGGSNMAAPRTDKLHWSDLGAEVTLQKRLEIKVDPKRGSVCVAVRAVPAKPGVTNELLWSTEDCKSNLSVICSVARACMLEECTPDNNTQKQSPVLRSSAVPAMSAADLQRSSAEAVLFSEDRAAKCNKMLCKSSVTANVNDRPSFQSFSRCGKMFHVSDLKMSLEDAANMCCKVNSLLLSLDSPEDKSCLQALVKENAELANQQIWVSAIRIAPGRHAWCTTGAVLPGKLEEEYLQVATSGLQLTAASNLSTAIFVCERSLGSASCEPACESTQHCAKNAKFSSSGSSAGLSYTYNVAIATPAPGTNVFLGCGSQIFFSRAMVTQQKAWLSCCSLGLRLVNIESNSKFKCIAQMYADLLPVNETRVYHTAATWNSCSKSTWWCESGRALDLAQQSKTSAKSVVVSTLCKLDPGLSYLSVAQGPADYQAYFMCEGTHNTFSEAAADVQACDNESDDFSAAVLQTSEMFESFRQRTLQTLQRYDEVLDNVAAEIQAMSSGVRDTAATFEQLSRNESESREHVARLMAKVL